MFGARADTSRGKRKILKMRYLDIRKAVEASLDIKDVIHQTSCFLNITPPSVHSLT